MSQFVSISASHNINFDLQVYRSKSSSIFSILSHPYSFLVYYYLICVSPPNRTNMSDFKHECSILDTNFRFQILVTNLRRQCPTPVFVFRHQCPVLVTANRFETLVCFQTPLSEFRHQCPILNTPVRFWMLESDIKHQGLFFREQCSIIDTSV